jgi:hypothetical protein
MIDIGMVGPGQIYVHATDASTQQLAQMATAGTGIAWSPRSNLDLYGATTPVDVAHRLGVDVMLGPDWTWSGSMNPVREMQCAQSWLSSRGSTIDDRTIWAMTTGTAARMLGLEGTLGVLEAGAIADISVYTGSTQPYRSVIESQPEDVQLVLVGGEALYGAPSWIERLADHPSWCETVDACGTERTVCVQSASSGEDAATLADIEADLSAALGAVSMPSELSYAGELFGLWMCAETRESCDLSEPTTHDADGDTIADGVDLCPAAYDPLQRDEDGDGLGDVCDPCPLDPTSATCSHDPADIDGDGVSTEIDVCPWIADPEQTDGDADDVGDACDPCPSEYSPDGVGCTYTLRALRDVSDPLHPMEGTEVTITDLIVTAVRAGTGFYVQDPSETDFGGILVYDSGTYSAEDATTPVAPGDVLTVSGVYLEYYDTAEIADPVVSITGTSEVPSPVEITDPCTIGTLGSLAEAYESMLVRVTDITVTDSNPDAPDDYGEFEVLDCLRFDDGLTDILVPQPDVGSVFTSLSGVLVYSYGNHKIMPRDGDDVTVE